MLYILLRIAYVGRQPLECFTPRGIQAAKQPVRVARPAGLREIRRTGKVAQYAASRSVTVMALNNQLHQQLSPSISTYWPRTLHTLAMRRC